jgi:tetratricopeptide (TPR) repeat protein
MEASMSDRSTRIVAIAAGAFALATALGVTALVPIEASNTSGLAGSSMRPCTAEQGQRLIDQGHYQAAIREFTCVVQAQPTDAEGYRGRAEARLLLGRYSEALRDYTQVTAFVLPVHPDAEATISAGYAARLAAAPDDAAALTGASFARWYFFDYPHAIQLLNRLVDVRPDDVYGNLFRGSSRLLQGAARVAGVADLERALMRAPSSPDVRFIVADAYTYGLPDPQRAFDEASAALAWGLDTPRVHAILAAAYLAFGNDLAAATHIKRHIDLVTTQLVASTSITAGDSLVLDLVPGRTYEIPVSAVAGETIEIMTSSGDFVDSILVLLAPDGTLVLGSDDYANYFAGLVLVAPADATYRLRVTSFESVSTGALLVTRD